MKTGVQLFTVRKQARNDLYKTLKELNDMGINYIEAARIDFNEENAMLIKKAYEDFGIKTISALIKYNILNKDFDKIVNFCDITRCKNVVISGLPAKNIFGGKNTLIDFCKKVNALAAKYNKHGIKLSYHHHDYEFVKRKYGYQFDLLKEDFDRNVSFVIDTFWVTKGGNSPDKVISALNKRVKGVHLRDYALFGMAKKAKGFAVGEGVIDFAAVYESSKQAMAEYAVIEQNTDNPFEELKKSIDFLVKQGFALTFK